MEKVKLFLDEDIHSLLSSSLRKRGFDVKHAQESDRKGRSDIEQIAYAIKQRRCLVSFNVKDYVKLHNEYVTSEREHCGIIVSKQLPVGETLSRLLTILHRHSQNSIKNRLLFLRKF